MRTARILILDDLEIRHSKLASTFFDYDRCHVYTAEGAMEALMEGGWDVVFLDHDLGDNPAIAPSMDFSYGYGGTPRALDGSDVAAFIVRNVPEDKWPGQVILHSVNTVGAQRMFDILSDAGVIVAKEPASSWK